MSPAYVSEVETGRKTPTLPLLRRLAAGLNVPPEALLAPTPVDPGNEAAPTGDDAEPADGEAGPADGKAGPAGGETGPARDGPKWGERLRLVRLARGKTLAETAQQAGLSASYLADIERGRSGPSLDALRKIAKALNYSVAALYHAGDPVLSAKLRQLRSSIGLSQADLARRVRVSPGLVSQLERGRVLPSLDTLERLADVLGVSPCYLIIEEPHLEDMLAAMNPELRELLGDPAVQSFLRMVCDLSGSEFRFVMKFIQLYKEHRRK